jgi:flagellar basal body-associated protein FliL
MTDERQEPLTEDPQLPVVTPETASATNAADKKRITIVAIVIAIIVIALLVLGTIYLVNPSHSDQTEQIRDVFIIFIALESFVIGVALVVLIIQLSNLINLLQNEIRPIINSTSETVNTLKGTAKFVSDNLSEPVIKINQLSAMIKQLFTFKKKKK